MAKEHYIESLIPDVVGSLKRIEESLVRPDSRPGEVSFANSNLPPPSQFYVQQGMKLRIRLTTAVANEVASLNALLLVDNRLVALTGATNPVSNNVASSTITITTTGFLVSASLTAAVAVFRGETYCTLQLLDQTGNFLVTLFSSYITTNRPASYPPITIEDPLAGYVPLQGYTIAAGVPPFIDQIQARSVWNLTGLRVVLTTDANAGNRSLRITIQNTGAVTNLLLLQPNSTYVVGAASTATYSFEQNVVEAQTVAGANPSFITPLPGPLLLTTGTVFLFEAIGGFPADDFHITYCYGRYLTF
jgi:hypothetical protein